jgi:hypothetical protein
MEAIFKFSHLKKKKKWMPSDLKITEEGTIEEGIEGAHHNTGVVEDENSNLELDMTLHPEEDITTQIDEDITNSKTARHCHKEEDSMDIEVPHNQAQTAPTMDNWEYGVLIVGKQRTTHPSVGPKKHDPSGGQTTTATTRTSTGIIF